MKQSTIISALCLMGPLTSPAQDAQQVYLDKRSSCHGADGAAASAKVSFEPMKIVEIGKGLDMPGYAKQLTAPQIQTVTEYSRSLGK